MLKRICTSHAHVHRAGDRWFSRTVLPVFVVGVVLLAAGVFGAWRVHRLHKRGSDILSDNVASIRSAEQLETITREIRHRLKRHLTSGNDRHLNDIHELVPRGLASLQEAEDLAKSTREQRLMERIRDGYDRLYGDFNQLSSEPSSIVRRETKRNLADHVIPNRILAQTQRYIDLNEQALDRSNQRNQATANQLMFGLLLLGTCGGAAGLIAGYGIARLVNNTIVQLAIPIRDTAGKLSQVAGPVALTSEPGFDDLESNLRTVSNHVTTVVERLQESERERLWAEQLATVGQLAAGLAHELRNPLTSMKAILQLASQADDLTTRDLEILREETGHLEHTVQSLLDFAKPPQPRKTETNLGTILEQSISLVDRWCQRKGVALKYVRAPADIVLLADGAQLRQLVLNILMNAIDATQRGGTICLQCQSEAASRPVPTRHFGVRNRFAYQLEERWVVIRVSDTGPGLPHDKMGRMFDPFFTTKEKGTGLGLSICKRIVRCHGGTISARNCHDGGAIFEARIPLPERENSPPHRHGNVATDSAVSFAKPPCPPREANGES